MASAVISTDDHRTGDGLHQAQAAATESNESTNPSSTSNKTAADPGRTQNPLKARKRTKTGCLSKLRMLNLLGFSKADLRQLVASDVSNAEKSVQLAAIVSSQNVTARATLHELYSKIH